MVRTKVFDLMKTTLILFFLLFGSSSTAQTMLKDTLNKDDVPMEVLNVLTSNKRVDSVHYFFQFGLFTYGMEYVSYDSLVFVDLHNTKAGKSTTEIYLVLPFFEITAFEKQILEQAGQNITLLNRSYTHKEKVIYEFVEDMNIRLIELERK
jgi:hypothetical protein